LDRAGGSYLEGVVRVFDLRMMRALAPVAFAPGAFRLKFHPVFSGTLMLMAQGGQLQVCDANGSYMNLQGYHVDTNGGVLHGMDVSSSGEVMFVCDSHGYLHQWVDREQPRLNLFPKALEQPTPVRPLPLILPDDDSVPLSLLDTGVHGLRNSSAQQGLLSTWPADMCFMHPQPQPPIPPVYLQNMQPARDGDFIMYAHVPKNPGFLRYQHAFPEPIRFVALSARHSDSVDLLAEPFSPVRGAAAKTESLLTPVASASSPATQIQVAKPPGLYQQKTISYTKLGVSGFDFEFYNRTPFSGLENTLPNSIVNGAIQMLYFVPQIRASLLAHLCDREFCLSCELGLLFKMLDRSAGAVCQASNLLRTLQNIPLARTMLIVGVDDSTFRDKRQGIALIERFVDFVVAQLKSEQLANEQDLFGSLLASSKKVPIVCRSCSSESHRDESASEPVRFIYQDDLKLSFGALLCQSLRAHFASDTRKNNDQDEWCERCGNKQPSRSHPAQAVATSLPPMLMILSNLGKTNSSNCEMWKSAGGRTSVSSNSNVVNSVLADDGGEGFLSGVDGPNVSAWLPSAIRVTVDLSGNIQVEEISSDVTASNRSSSSSHELSAVYAVSSILCHIHDPRKMPSPGHSVLHQKIAPSHVQVLF
jgi:hypothetical protein